MSIETMRKSYPHLTKALSDDGVKEMLRLSGLTGADRLEESALLNAETYFAQNPIDVSRGEAVDVFTTGDGQLHVRATLQLEHGVRWNTVVAPGTKIEQNPQTSNTVKEVAMAELIDPAKRAELDAILNLCSMMGMQNLPKSSDEMIALAEKQEHTPETQRAFLSGYFNGVKAGIEMTQSNPRAFPARRSAAPTQHHVVIHKEKGFLSKLVDAIF